MSADEIILDSNSGGSSTPREQHPIGQHIGVCVDVISLGERVSEFGGKAKVQGKIAFVFQTGQKDSEGRLFEVNREFTLSSHEKAGLPKFLGEWRGVPFTPEEIKAGIRVAGFVGLPGIITFVAKPSKKGTVYTNIGTVIQLFGGLESKIPVLPPYTRASFWATKKTEYADGVAEHKRKEALKAMTATGPTIAPPAVTADQKAIADAAADASVAKAIAAVEGDEIPF